MTTTRHLLIVAAAESEAVADLVEKLRTRFTVRTAYDWAALRESLDEAVDVVVLDSDLPGLDPAALGEHLERERFECQVGVLSPATETAVPAVADAILETSAPYEEVERTVARMAARAGYQKCLERLYALAVRRSELVTNHGDQLDEEQAAELSRIENQIEHLRAEISETLDRLDDTAAFEAALDQFDDEST